jgi:hypothetical protein
LEGHSRHNNVMPQKETLRLLGAEAVKRARALDDLETGQASVLGVGVGSDLGEELVAQARVADCAIAHLIHLVPVRNETSLLSVAASLESH